MTKSPKVIYKQLFIYSLSNCDRNTFHSDSYYNDKVLGMFNYFSNVKKRVVNMFDYYSGNIIKKEKVNLVLENGKYATENEIKKRKKQYLKYIKNANLYQGIISFNNEDIDGSIELRELEKKIATEIIPKFLKKVGFVDVKKMSYQIALHCNTDNYHFHISFIEKCPNFENKNGTIGYRRKGMFTEKEINYIKNEIVNMIFRHKEFTPLIKSANEEIEELKKYFKVGERNFVLKNIDDVILEENILKLGEKLYKYEKDYNGNKIKYNSIYDKDIKTLTNNIKDYLFNNKNSDLYEKYDEFNNTLKEINKYFKRINNDNNIKSKFKSEYSKNKEKYLNNYILNAIANYSIKHYEYCSKNNKIDIDDLIRSIISKSYKKNKKSLKYNALNNYLNVNKNTGLVSRKTIEYSLKKINDELESATCEFEKLFKDEEKDMSDNI